MTVQSCLVLEKLLELTGNVLDTASDRAYSSVPASSSEGAQDHVPTAVLTENAEEKMEKLL